jgi:hypothetical protein
MNKNAHNFGWTKSPDYKLIHEQILRFDEQKWVEKTK